MPSLHLEKSALLTGVVVCRCCILRPRRRGEDTDDAQIDGIVQCRSASQTEYRADAHPGRSPNPGHRAPASKTLGQPPQRLARQSALPQCVYLKTPCDLSAQASLAALFARWRRKDDATPANKTCLQPDFAGQKISAAFLSSVSGAAMNRVSGKARCAALVGFRS